jgi:hypothetical protein
MDPKVALVPSPAGDGSGYIELARSKQGRVFRKHILNKGDLVHPKTRKKVAIDDAFVNKLIQNFDNHVCDIVQVPLAGAANEHTEDPSRNIGEVIGIEADDDKVYALIDARDEEAANKLGKTLLGASAYLHMNYTDNKVDKQVGPTLLHVAVTNRPYVTGLDSYEELIAASADNYEDVVMFSNEEHSMTKDELLAELKAEHGIDVGELEVALSAAQSDREQIVRLGAALADSDYIALSEGEEIGLSDVLAGVTKLAEENVELSNQVQEGVRLSVEREVDDLVAQARIFPSQRDAFVELKLSNEEMFDALVPDSPIVALGDEQGTSHSDANSRKPEEDIDDEIARLTASDSPLVKSGTIKVEG